MLLFTALQLLTSLETIAQNTNEQIAASTVLITYNYDGIEKSGSGFVVFKETNKNNHTGLQFLITNLHILRQSTGSVKMRFFRSDYSNVNTKMELTIQFKDENGNYLPNVRMNQNKEDLVAIDITEDFIKDQIQGQSLPYQLLATKDTLKKYNISIGDDIYMIGYPNAIFDNQNYSPVFRYGIIATIPTEGYNFNLRLQNKYNFPKFTPGFLIDAGVFEGSSGSLVVLKPQIGKVYNGFINMGTPPPYILGIVYKSIPIDDDSPQNIQRLGLGVVYSAQTIKDTIDFGIRLAE